MTVPNRLRVVVFCIAPFAAALACSARSWAESAATPLPRASTTMSPDDARGRNLVILDSVVFVLGVALLGGVIVWWGRRIFTEK